MKTWLIFAVIHITLTNWSQCDQLPVGLISHQSVVEHCTGIEVVVGSNPGQA